jgi:transposase-like protein
MHFDEGFIKKLMEMGFDIKSLLLVGVQLLISDMIEFEAKDYIDRNNERLEDGRLRLSFNGKYPREIVTPLGTAIVEMPRIIDRKGGTHKGSGSLIFSSRMLPRYMKSIVDLEEAVPWLYLNGFSTTQFGEFYERLYSAPEAKGLSPSTISRLMKTWSKDYDLWQCRELTGLSFPYVSADGIHFNMRGADIGENQAVLALLGVGLDGKKKMLGMHTGFSENAGSWKTLILNLRARGMESPRLMIGDAGLGLWKGLREVYPDCAIQYCWFHKVGDVKDELPKSLHGKAVAMLKDVRLQPTREEALKAIDVFAKSFEVKYAKAVRTVVDNADRLLTYYDFPAQHWLHLRTNCIMESIFSSVRLRTSKTRGMLGNKMVLPLAHKLADLACGRSRAIHGVAQLRELCGGTVFRDGLPCGEDGI